MSRLEKFTKDHLNKPIADSLSKISNWLNGTPIEVEAGKVVIKYTVRDEMTNYQGVLHGGVSAMIMDDMCGMICMLSSSDDVMYSTINLVVDYLKGAKVGDELIATAKVVKLGRTIANVEAYIHHSNGTLLVKATSNLVNVPVKV